MHSIEQNYIKFVQQGWTRKQNAVITTTYLLQIARAQIAQLVEQGTENPCVVGSIPTLGTISRGVSFYLCVIRQKNSTDSS